MALRCALLVSCVLLVVGANVAQMEQLQQPEKKQEVQREQREQQQEQQQQEEQPQQKNWERYVPAAYRNFAEKQRRAVDSSGKDMETRDSADEREKNDASEPIFLIAVNSSNVTSATEEPEQPEQAEQPEQPEKPEQPQMKNWKQFIPKEYQNLVGGNKSEKSGSFSGEQPEMTNWQQFIPKAFRNFAKKASTEHADDGNGTSVNESEASAADLLAVDAVATQSGMILATGALFMFIAVFFIASRNKRKVTSVEVPLLA